VVVEGVLVESIATLRLLTSRTLPLLGHTGSTMCDVHPTLSVYRLDSWRVVEHGTTIVCG
jgi:hypothetical protein